MEFKWLRIKRQDDLESKINDFIQGKDIISLKIINTPGSVIYTHEVYITYKKYSPDQMIKDFAELLEMIASDVSAGWDPDTISKRGYKNFVEKYIFIVPPYLQNQVVNAIIED
jgi:hypothetical protein